MIENLRVVRPDLAEADGEIYDFEKVWWTVERFLTGCLAEIIGAFPDAKATCRYPFDARWRWWHAGSFARAADVYRKMRETYDVEMAPFSLKIGPYHIAAYPLGRDDLFASPDGMHLVDEGSWETLDPMPLVECTPAGQIFPLFEADEERVMAHLIRQHAPLGTLAVTGRIMGLKFPHVAFGAGRGTLRIRLITTDPVD